MLTIVFNQPTTAFEPSLYMRHADLMNEVSDQQGYGTNYLNLSAGDLAKVQRFVNAGLRTFYMSYDWSFLKPVTTIDTVADDKDYDMPLDFASLEGDITFDAGEGRYQPLPLVSEWKIREQWQYDDATGRPRMAAVRPKSHTGAVSQRQELLLYPIPDDAYTLHYRYRVLPNSLTDENSYPYGTEMHSETIKEACLAAAERDGDDESAVHAQAYDRLLRISMQIDQRNAPEYLGFNLDKSDNTNLVRPRDKIYVTVNGSIPS